MNSFNTVTGNFHRINKGFTRLVYFNIFILPLSFFWHLLGLGSSAIMFIGYYTILLGIFYIFKGKFQISRYQYLLLIYFLYKVFVDYFFNSQMEGNFIRVLKYSSPYLAFFFFIVILNNTYSISYKLIKICNSVILITLAIAPVISFIQLILPGFSVVFNQVSEIGNQSFYQIRRNSIFDLESNVAFSLSFLPVCTVLISRLLNDRSYSKLLFCLFLLAIPVLLSNTRVVMLGYLVIVTMAIIKSDSKVFGIFQRLFLVLIIASTSYLLLNMAGYNIDKFYDERIQEGPLVNSPRYSSYLAFLEVFPKQPIFGTGNPTSELIKDSLTMNRDFIHIGWLSHIATYGLLGSFLLFGFIFYLLKNLYKSARNTGFYAPIFAFSIYILANFTFVETNFYTSGLITVLVYSRFFQLENLK